MKKVFSLLLALVLALSLIPGAALATTYVPDTGLAVFEFVLPQWDFDQTADFQGGFSIVRKGNKSGIVDKTGTLFLPVEYDYISRWQVGGDVYYRLEKDGKRGLLGKNGSIFLPVEYDKINQYWDWYGDDTFFLSLEKSGKYGAVADGKVIPAVYDSIEPFAEGLWKVRIGDSYLGKYGIINNNNIFVTPAIYDGIDDRYGNWDNAWFDNLAIVYIGERSATGSWVNRKYGLIGQDGTIKHDTIYSGIYTGRWWNGDSYEEYGVAQVCDYDSGKYGLMRKDGTLVQPMEFDGIDWGRGNDHNELLFVRKDGLYGYVNSQSGEFVLPLNSNWTSAQSFSDGLAAVLDKDTSHWGFIGNTGTFVIPPTYTSAERFTEGTAWVRDGTYWGLIDKLGTTVINSEYKNSSPFYNETAWVQNSADKWVLINKSGQTLANLDDSSLSGWDSYRVERLSNGLAFVTVSKNTGGNGYAVIDDAGKVTEVMETPDNWRSSGTSAYSEDVIIFSYRANGTENVYTYGAMDKNGIIVSPHQYGNVSIKLIGDNLLAVQRDDDLKWHLIDRAEHSILGNNWYSNIGSSNNSPIAVEDGSGSDRKCGLLDKDGNVIFAIEWDRVSSYYGTYYSAYRQGESYFDDDGNYINTSKSAAYVPVTGKKYDNAGSWSDGASRITVVKEGDKWGLLGDDGNLLTGLIYDEMYNSYDGSGLISVRQDGKYGRISKTGVVILAVEYDKIWYYWDYNNDDGVWIAGKEDKWGLIDKGGAPITGFIYDSISGVYEGLICVAQGGKSGFIDKVGNVVIALEYDYIARFNNGLAAVNKNGKWGFINKAGEVVVPITIECSWIEPFNDGLALIRSYAGYSYIDRNGSTVFTEYYSQASSFSEGLAWVLKDGKWGLLCIGDDADAPKPKDPDDPGQSPDGNNNGNNGNGGTTTPETSPTPSVPPSENPGVTVVETKVDKDTGTATAEVTQDSLSSAIEQAQKQDHSSITIQAELPAGVDIDDVKMVELSISGALFEDIVNTGASLTIETPIAGGAVGITLNDNALETISKAGDGEVKISAAVVDKSDLPPNLQDLVKDRPVYDFNVTVGGENVHDFGVGRAKIEIPYTLAPGENPNAVTVYYLNNHGKLEMVRGFYDTKSGAVIFTTNHFSQFIIDYSPIRFTDIPNDWSKNAIEFIAARDYALGITGNTFEPSTLVTRGAFTATLMRAYGIAVDETATANFADVDADAPYAAYLATAKKMGIVNGVGDNLYAPERTIGRAEMFALLYNILLAIDEAPTADGSKTLSDFPDAEEVNPSFLASIEALIEAGILTGTGTGTLSPKKLTSRAEMAEMIYKLLTR